MSDSKRAGRSESDGDGFLFVGFYCIICWIDIILGPRWLKGQGGGVEVPKKKSQQF